MANKKALEAASSKLTKVSEILGVLYSISAVAKSKSSEDGSDVAPPQTSSLQSQAISQLLSTSPKDSLKERNPGPGSLLSSITFNSTLNNTKASSATDNKLVKPPSKMRFVPLVFKAGDRVKLKKSTVDQINADGIFDYASASGIWIVTESIEDSNSSDGKAVKKDLKQSIIGLKQGSISIACKAGDIMHEYEKSKKSFRTFKDRDRVKLSSSFNRSDTIHGGSNGCLGTIADKRIGYYNYFLFSIFFPKLFIEAKK
jgi:hypothetical protein